MTNITPIKLLPARERVASALRKAIIGQEFKAGTELSLESTSQLLGVSVTPTREAFQILAHEGLIELRPNKGAIVVGVNEKNIRDHYETRAILESECARKICLNGANLTSVFEAYEQAKKALSKNDSTNYSNYNQAFHVAIWDCADNAKIKSLLATMWNGLSIGSDVSEADYAQISIKEHDDLVDALRKRDAESAAMHMKNHIIRSMENVLTNL